MAGGGGSVPSSHMVGTSAGEPIFKGGLMKGGIDLMGGPNFDRLYHIN